MNIQGKDTVIKGAVLFALADTLAAHSLGGFKVGVGFALRKCRMCLATQEQVRTKVRVIMCMCTNYCVLWLLTLEYYSCRVCYLYTDITHHTP